MSESEETKRTQGAEEAAAAGTAGDKPEAAAAAAESQAEAAAADKSADAPADKAADKGAAPKRKLGKRQRLGVTIACAAAVVVAAGAGFMVWHEQPSFCNAICHSPMDSYVATYEATPGESATDKWGNEVQDASSMLASVHGQVGKTCLDCHVPQLDEQMAEGAEWVTGSYDADLGERTATQLVEARGLEDTDEFCMNDSCHPYTREDLEKKTAWMGKINPHTPQHGEQKCTTCHKAHRASVNYCTQCHTDAVVPDGWLDYTQSKELEEAAGSTDEQ